MELTLFELFRCELRCIAWRLQYKCKAEMKREVPMIYDLPQSSCFTIDVINHLLISDLMNSIPSETGKRIIYDLYFMDQTETQISKKMNISQQGVNKWKRKTLKLLSQTQNFHIY